MSIEVIDLVDMGHKEKRRKNVFNTPRFHAWMHYYKPGQKDGECTMSFPDGGKATLKAGQAALITGGSFYTLENTGDGPMIMMGNRSGPAENIQIIDYVTRKDIRQKVQAEVSNR
jgi:hypothetical protein